MPEKKAEGVDAQLKRIGELCAERKRDDYESLLKRFTEARELFHDMLAQRFSEPFNTHLAQQPQAKFQEKQAMTREANADLRALGLAVQCPKTGEPAVLHADPGHKPAEGRFLVSLISTELGRKKTLTSHKLFHVELRGNPTRREGAAEYWAKQVAEGRFAPRDR